MFIEQQQQPLFNTIWFKAIGLHCLWGRASSLHVGLFEWLLE